MIVFQTTPRPINSPWGAVQTANELAPGIWDVSTAGHGGLMLSPERNAGVPNYMRDQAGQYEEDLAWASVALVYPDVFTKSAVLVAHKSALNWQPAAYARFTGKVIQPGESYTLDCDAFEAFHAADWIASTAFGAWASFVERGQVGLCCQRRSDRSEAWFIVPEAEYAKRGRFGFVIDPARHIRIQRPAKPWADHPERIRLAA